MCTDDWHNFDSKRRVINGCINAELVKAISTPLGACVKGFPQAERLHPFERALLDLTIGLDLYEKRLARLTSLRQSAVQV